MIAMLSIIKLEIFERTISIAPGKQKGKCGLQNCANWTEKSNSAQPFRGESKHDTKHQQHK